jgi:gliding motility-associated-like protein
LIQNYFTIIPFSALKMKPIIYFFTAGLLLIATQIFGQALVTNLTPATVTAPIGSTVDLQLKVTNFTDINSIQFPITYNATVLQFVSIDNSALPGFTNGNYNVPTAGKINVSWFADPGSYPTGFTLPANTSIFTLHFTVLANGTANVNLANVPPGIEVIRNGTPINVEFGSGGSQVTGGTGVTPPIQGFAIIANTIYIPQGTMGCMPVTVNDFDSITGMQYAMHWDPAVLQYQNTQSYNLPDLGSGSFGGTPNTGTLTLLWSDPAAIGVTRANGTKIYDVCFNAIGPVGSQSLITIDSVGFPAGSGGAEAFNAASQNVWTSNSGVKDTIFIVTAPPPPNAVTFFASQETVGAGGQAWIEVSVLNFNSIISMQFGMTYDATQLQFVSLTPNPNVPGLALSNFNTGGPGVIKVSWIDPNVAGVTLPDSTLLFTVCFTAAGPVGSTTPVNFGSVPGLPVEVVKVPDGPVNPAFVNGHVHVAAVVPPDASVATTPACGANNGSATANAVNGTVTSYAWSTPGGNQQTISNLAAGTYTVTVTFAGGSTVVRSGTVVSSAPVTQSQQVMALNVKCFGENNGSVSLTTSGGTAPFNWSWTGPSPFTANTEDITGLGPGNYVLSITDSKGCTLTESYTVSTPQVLSVTLASSQNVACFGDSTGSININAAGGNAGPANYSWINLNTNQLVSTAKNPTGLPAGTYCVTMTDSQGCTDALDNCVIITAPNSALSVATPVTKTDLVCWGYSNGSISLNINGGWGGYTVAWDPQPYTGANLVNIPGGNYTPTITDAGGCTFTMQAIQVIEPLAIDDGTPVIVHNNCANDGAGSISIQVSGGNGPPYTVIWNGGLGGETISSLAGGNYVPTITDGTGCTAVLPPYTVNEPTKIDTGVVVVVAPTSGQSNGSISPDLSGGTGTLHIFWQGPNNYVADTANISGLAAGVYKLTVVDDNDCVFTADFIVGGALVVIANTTPSCGNDGCLNIQIASGVPPFIISWTGSSAGQSVTSDLSASICTFPPGVIIVSILDNASNAITLPQMVIDALEPALAGLSFSPPIEDSGNGSITLIPVAAQPINFSYSWAGPNGPIDDDQPTQNNLDHGVYSVTVTNVNSGCTAVYTETLVRQWQTIGFTQQTTPAKCTNTPDGTISITVAGGNDPYTYEWAGPNGPLSDDNKPSISGLVPGAYSITVTDQNDTVKVFDVTLSSQSLLNVTNVNETSSYGNPPYQVSGANQCDGVASVVFSGGVGATSILWSNNVATAQNTALCAGQYSVTVTDNLGCTAVWLDSLTYPPGVTATPVAVNAVSCHGECDGVIRVFVNGGVAPYTVKWSTGQSDQLATSGGFSQAVNLCGGDYKVTITDKLGADYVYDVPVPEPAPIVINFSSVDPTTFNSCNGEIIADAPGAVEPFVFTWSGSYGHSGEGQRAEGLCAGEIVSFVLYDGNGCAGIGVDTIAYPEDGCYQVRPVITPGQQDGNNDFVFITCIEVVPNSIEIYNRWGQLVFETEGYDNSGNVWKGLSKNGQPLADGVYYYVLNYTDPTRGAQQQKGHINLLR